MTTLLGDRMVEAADALLDDRPLIDIVHEATFTAPRTMLFIKDKYALRMLLRKAHRFMLNDATSALVSDFSLAIIPDLEGARQLAVPPFPVTWFEVNNTARLLRSKELGVQYIDPEVFGSDYGPVINRCGWLIHPAPYPQDGHLATYFAVSEKGAFALPMSFFWHTRGPDYDVWSRATETDRRSIKQMQWLCFGVTQSSGVMAINVGPTDAYPYPAPFQPDVLDIRQPSKAILEMMIEMAGELRHIWGLLIAMGAGQLGVEADTSGRVQHTGPIRKAGDKPLLPLEHKVLHLHLNKRVTPKTVVLRAISHHKNREHDVRTHFRTYRNEDGTVRRRTLIKDHKRGDIRLGRIEKTYRVER